MPLTKTYLCLALKESVQSFTERHEDIVVDLDCPTMNAAIDADRFLSVLMMNLLDNTVTHSAKPGCHVWVKLEEVADGYEIAIADDGPGISDSVKKTLFDPNRRFGGVGIHQASQIVREYGGSIEVGDRVPSDSSLGAKFLVRLPKRREHSQAE
ncbi:MAG: sensor histidine kinase [Candidatus Thorarchaeota archaeon]